MTFRYARHTAKLDNLIYFYTSIFDFKILGEFKNHNGYDGVLLGKENQNWHLEFTQNKETPNSTFDDDDILVFYPETHEEYNSILENLKKYEVPILKPQNPYWEINGIYFEDCEHYKIVVSPLKIENFIIG